MRFAEGNRQRGKPAGVHLKPYHSLYFCQHSYCGEKTLISAGLFEILIICSEIGGIPYLTYFDLIG